ncbi:MAG: hypothetical protein KAT68_01135 [Bacteroidales bacterium]|nr:hypothetical protein [Bacteroidales bacterium]
MKRKILTVILLIIFNNVFSQNKMNDYEKYYYCMVGYLHPQRVIESHNNWDLLNTLADGKTLSELDELGVTYSKKQLDILQLLNFVKKQDEKYYSTVCILNEEKTKKMRSETFKMATEIVNQISKDYSIFQGILLKQGFENNTYTVFFSYIMDNLVWDELEKQNYKTMRELTPEQPFWSGNVWFVNPKRNFSCGTNSITENGSRANLNWSRNSGVSFNNYNSLSLMIDDYKKHQRITDEKNKEFLMTYGLCREDGSITFPIIRNDSLDEINSISKNIAQTIINYLIKEIDFSSIMSQYGIQTKTEAIVILFHEIMWDILDIMEENKQIKKPIAFSEPKNCKKTDLKDLFFVVEE